MDKRANTQTINIRGIDCSTDKNIVLIGKNGCGKSTALTALKEDKDLGEQAVFIPSARDIHSMSIAGNLKQSEKMLSIT